MTLKNIVGVSDCLFHRVEIMLHDAMVRHNM